MKESKEREKKKNNFERKLRQTNETIHCRDEVITSNSNNNNKREEKMNSTWTLKIKKRELFVCVVFFL